MTSETVQLYPDSYYHIYNHGNARDNIFLNDDNYIYFLKRYSFFINPVASTLAYCLMPNHFHFVVQMKSEIEIQKLIQEKFSDTSKLQTEKTPDFILKKFSNFFNSYSKAFNIAHNRKGKLFRIPFKRKLLHNNDYLQKAIHYVHLNPVHHSFVNNMNDWIYSSIHAYENNKKTQIDKQKGILLFNGIENFKRYHQQPVDVKYKIEMDF